MKIPSPLKRILLWVIDIIIKIFSWTNEKRLHHTAKTSLGLSLNDYLRLTGQFEHHKRTMYEFWIASEVDIIITPGCAVPAVKHKQSGVRVM
jgi:hypothetical protein